YEWVRVRKPDPRSLFRSGVAEDIARRAKASGADAIVVDASMSPSQARNLEDATGFAVRDREAIILNVFQKHVKTKKARIQVEIAHLEYLRPRIRGLGLEMDQQAGGIVGMRGAGETASELLARQLDRRLVSLRKAVVKIENSGARERKGRTQCRRIALLGYTNAGKTTLMNGLTGADLSAADKPFETLDTTSRRLSGHGGDVLLSDTVGFIRNLPKRLLVSFQTTLAEIVEADLLVIVVDVSDVEAELHIRTTEAIVGELESDEIARLYVFTKLDRCSSPLGSDSLVILSRGNPYIVLDGTDRDAVLSLRKELLARVRGGRKVVGVFVDYENSEALSLVYAKARVISALPEESGIRFVLEIESRWLDAIEKAMQGVSNDRR
ncbi:MAG: GTPase HflX, partial [Kofleriaceae bacterium]|nr:GTPase HflX [Kofleriaceae bacterium]